MADFSKILEQAQQMQGRLEQVQAELANMSVTGTAGGGMVTVDADGKGQITKVRVDPSIVSASDVEMLEDLILVALRDAQQKSTDLAKQEMSKLTGGLGLPFKLPF
ncbi:MAG TPA: YbaB/EbfC family nucleoid-associated protein [Gemmatimonadaceae bacterium]|jgi:DNA-binding YbaB/EbfC family protein|nr:YbaB/EbfC family nucleoid-associated protein [Gemmatimonadaceae bacterium]